MKKIILAILIAGYIWSCLEDKTMETREIKETKTFARFVSKLDNSDQSSQSSECDKYYVNEQFKDAISCYEGLSSISFVKKEEYLGKMINLFSSYIHMDMFTKAKELEQNIRNVLDKEDFEDIETKIRFRIVQGRLERKLENSSGASKFWKEGLELLDRIEDSKERQRLEVRLFILLTEISGYEIEPVRLSETALRKAKELYDENQEANYQLYASALCNYARAYIYNSSDSYEDTFEKTEDLLYDALNIINKFNVEENLLTAKIYGVLSISNHYKKHFHRDYKNSRDSFKVCKNKVIDLSYKIIDIRTRILGESHTLLTEPLNNLANNGVDQVDNLQKCIKIYEGAYKTKKHHHIALFLNNLGRKYARIDLDSSLFYFQESIKSLSYSFNDNDISTNPKIDGNIINDAYLYEILEQKGHALRKKFDSSRQLQYLDAAMNTFERDIELVNKMRSGYITDDSKNKIGDVVYSLYETGIQVAYQLYELTGDQDYLNRLYKIMQFSKSNILIDQLAAMSITDFGIDDIDLVNERKQIDIDLNVLEEKRIQQKKLIMQGVVDEERLQDIDDSISLFNLKREDIVNKIERLYPAYSSLWKNRFISYEEMREEILQEENQYIIDYFISDKDSMIYQNLIGYNSNLLIRTKFDSEVEHLILELRNLSSNPNSSIDSIKNTSYRIYSTIFQPIDSILPLNSSVRIIPHRELSLLNFDILTKKDDEGEFKYLVNDYAFSYLPSVLFEKYSNINKREINKKGVVSFAPFASGNFEVKNEDLSNILNLRNISNDELPILPNTKRELNGIGELFEMMPYYNKEANEKNFRDESGLYDIIHIASHAVVDDSLPSLSSIILQQTSNDFDSDGFLTVNEIYGMRFNAQMVVLSACNTGLGKLNHGEGMVSLARAFMYSGVPSVIMSQWNASDAITADLVTDFYSKLSLGRNKDFALREAKINFITKYKTDKILSHPFYWGPLLLNGDNTSLKSQDVSYYWIWYLVGGVILSSIVFFLLYRCRKSA